MGRKGYRGGNETEIPEMTTDTKKAAKAFFSTREERWNTWTHAAGILLGACAGAAWLPRCIASGDPWAEAGIALYLAGMLLSYVSSTAYHAARPGSARKARLRKWDHSAIYWHIAGSYAPITLVAMRPEGAWAWGLTAFVYACAVAGTAVSIAGLKDHSHAETACFVLMGMSILAAFGPLSRCVGGAAVGWIVAEGVAYVTGAAFYTLHGRPYMHTVFHFFVLAGSACHIMAVEQIVAQHTATALL